MDENLRFQKKRQLFLRQKKTMDLFLERGAISQVQYDKSLHDLAAKMGWKDYEKGNEMQLSSYDEKLVRVTDTTGQTFTGVADFLLEEFCRQEYGVEEDALKIGEELLNASRIAAVEEITAHGTAELRTSRLILRRYRLEDADALYQQFGTDPVMYEYSGWNPYATPEMARETVREYLERYQDDHFYGWAMEFEGTLIGSIGAYDLENDQIEVGYSVARSCWGRGYATEALQAVLRYLTENENIGCVTAWCARENLGSSRVLEKAGMQLVRTEPGGVAVGDRRYDKLVYAIRRPS